MHLVQHFSKAPIPLQKNNRFSRSSSQPFAVHADSVLVVRKCVSFHEFFQFRKLTLKSLGTRTTHLCSHVSSSTHWLPSKMPALNYSVTHRSYLPLVFVSHGKWLAGRPGTTILLQRNQSVAETLDQVHFSCRRPCWKVTKYDVRISYS